MARAAGSARVTIGHVADLARVSRATVSRVMNGVATVDPLISARVRAAAEQLSYAPSAAARSLALGRTHMVGFMVPDLTNPAFHGAMRGLGQAAGLDGYRVLVADSAENVAEEPILALETRRRCDALVLFAPRSSPASLRDLLPELAPVVLVNATAGDDDPTPVLAVDWASGIRDLVRHLVGLGHRRIAYLAGPVASASNADRLRGFATLDVGFDLVKIGCGALFGDGHAVAGEVLDSGVTAVVAFNDVVALGLLGALHELGVDVPGKISVVGFDDIPFARYTSPALTTAAIPQDRLGELSWQRLRTLLDGGTPDRTALFRPRLVTRGSSGRVPAS